MMSDLDGYSLARALPRRGTSGTGLLRAGAGCAIRWGIGQIEGRNVKGGACVF